MNEKLKAAIVGLAIAVGSPAFAQSGETRVLEMTTPDGQKLHIEIPYAKERGRYSLQEEAELNKKMMEKTMYRMFREAKCDSYKALLNNLAGMLSPIEVPQQRRPAQVDPQSISIIAQSYVDRIEDPKLQGFVVTEINNALRDPKRFQETMANGEWNQGCYEFMVENYFPEAAAKFQF